MKIDECINLKERFGQKYKVTYEESYYAERTIDSLVDPWMMIIPCRYGHIFPHGDNMLAVSVNGHTRIAGTIRRLPCCKVHQDGDHGEMTVLFDVKDFDRVAAIMLPRRRPILSDEQRAAMAERMKAIRSISLEAERKCESTARQCDASTRGDSQAVQV